MMRSGIAALLLLMAAAPFATATPYNTITVDGEWGPCEWDQANETYATNTNPGWNNFGDVKAILVTWDASNLYVGIWGNSWDNAMLIYIDSSSLTTGQENADWFQGFDTQSFFDPDFVGGHYNMEWGDGNIPTDIRSISAVDGSTASLLGTAQIAVHDYRFDGGLGEGLTEIAIPWSLLGLETGGSVKVACGVGWANQKDPVIPAGGLGGFSGDELGGDDQLGGTDGDESTLDTPVMVVYDVDEDGLPDHLPDLITPTLVGACTLEGDNSVVVANFDECVTQASAENTANWSITGGLSITGATLQVDPAYVLLQLSADADYGTSYTVTASNIEDLNENVCGPSSRNFCLAQLTFFAHLNYKILEAGEDPPLDVALEGGVLPLTWDPTCDDLMYDDGSHGDAEAGDSIYTTQIDFCLPYGEGEDPPTEPLIYKLTYGCTDWEDIDHFYTDPGLTCSTGQDTVDIWWNDNNPEWFTNHPIDVVFSVDLADSLARNRVLAGINGGKGNGDPIPPLNWNLPSENALSDADYPGGVEGDYIYGTVLRFPTTSFKSVQYKYLVNDNYECLDQWNRGVILNDAAYDTLNGDLGPLVLPTLRVDRCSVTQRDVKVIFRVDMSHWYQPPGPGDVIALNGGREDGLPIPPLNWSVPSENPMLDDGFEPDETEGDLIYSLSVEFPDSSDWFVSYKYLFNDAYECTTQTNRWFWINSIDYNNWSNPQVLDVDIFFLCQPVGVDDGVAAASPVSLDANWPNPFNPSTTLRFVLAETGPVRLEVHDLSGRLVRTLINSEAPAGEHHVVWNGKDESGRPVSSGIYFAKLSAGGRVVTTKMTLLK